MDREIRGLERALEGNPGDTANQRLLISGLIRSGQSWEAWRRLRDFELDFEAEFQELGRELLQQQRPFLEAFGDKRCFKVDRSRYEAVQQNATDVRGHEAPATGLFVDSRDFNDAERKAFTDLPGLEWLYWAFPRGAEDYALLSQARSLHSLHSLHLLLLDFASFDLSQMASRQSLQELSIQSLRSLEKDHYLKLTELAKLRSLRFECGGYEAGIGELKALKKLSSLEIRSGRFEENVLYEIAELTALESLTLARMKKNPILKLDFLASLTNLKSLSLRDKFIENASGIELLKGLEELSLSKCQVSGEIVGALESLPKLRVLGLDSSSFQVEDLKRIIALPGLKRLTLDKRQGELLGDDFLNSPLSENLTMVDYEDRSDSIDNFP